MGYSFGFTLRFFEEGFFPVLGLIFAPCSQSMLFCGEGHGLSAFSSDLFATCITELSVFL